MAAIQVPSLKEQKTSLTPLPSKGSHYLGRFICNILGDKAYLYLKEEGLEAHVYSQKGEVVKLPFSQIQGGKEGNMPQDALIQLVQTVSAPLLFASYHPDGNLHVFAREFQEIQKNQFLKPRIHLPPDFFECVTRKEVLKTLRKTLEEKQMVVLVKDPKLTLKRVGKTEIAQQYLKEYAREYTHVFWIHAFDPWYFQKDLEDMASELKISMEDLPQFLAKEPSYLVIFDGLSQPELLERYFPGEVKGHILVTSKEGFWKQKTLQVGLLTKKEGVEFLLKHAKGNEQEAKEITQTLGGVPSSLYRAVETIAVEGLTLSAYGMYCETRLGRHAHAAKEKGNLPSRNQDFCGREANLVALEECFSTNKPVVLAANKGLGGVGKTQIAMQYAYRTCPDYNLIWWVNALDIDLSYTALAERLRIYLTDEEKKEEHAIIKRVNNYLESYPGWLLVFDNVEDAESVKGLLPESGGHVLMTTRSTKWDQTQVEVFEVEIFEREESVELIFKITDLYGQETEAGNLAETLQDLPLAIAQAAAYIRETGITIEEYVEDFKKCHDALWEREKPTNNYEFTVRVTWNFSMKKIQEKESAEMVVPYPVALPLMQLCSFLAPNDIPRDVLLLEWMKMEYSKRQLDLDACLGDLNRTLALLRAFSMIRVGEEQIFIHSLVQTVIKDIVIKNEAVAQETLKNIDFLFRKHTSKKQSAPIFTYWDTKPNTIQRLYLLQPHAMAFIPYLENLKMNDVVLEFLHSIGCFSLQQGNFKIAAQTLTRAVNLKRTRGGLKNLGMVYLNLGKLEEAKILFEESKDIDGIVQVLIKLERFDLAKLLLEQQLNKLKTGPKIIEETRVEYYIGYALRHLGIVLINKGEYQEAISNLAEAKKAFDVIFKPNNQTSAEVDVQIAGAYMKLGDVNSSIVHTQMALSHYETVTNKKKPNTINPRMISLLKVLGQLNKIKKDFIQAKKCLDEASELAELKLGGD